MKFYLGVTDNNWFQYLRHKKPEDVNFWQPGGSASFKVLTPGAPFLFKLKSPLNALGGLGFFSSHTFLPITVAWETFGNRNGCDTYLELTRMIMANRHNRSDSPIIGCIVLTNPIFFNREDWIEYLLIGARTSSRENRMTRSWAQEERFGIRWKPDLKSIFSLTNRMSEKVSCCWRHHLLHTAN